MRQWKGLLPAVIRGKCPTCRQGDIFKGVLEMNETCSHCGIKFEREEGFFAMSIFIGYTLYAIIFIPVVYFLIRSAAELSAYLWMCVAILLLAPLVFRYARILWIHIDALLDPRNVEEV